MSRQQRGDMVSSAHIREQHHLSLQSYGRRRMAEELQEQGVSVGRRRVGRLMRENRIKIVGSRKYRATTDSKHGFNIAPNLPDQDFSATVPNQKWADDLSYIWTSGGWLYRAVILYVYCRRVIGWAVSSRLKRDLVIRALDMAEALRQPSEGCFITRIVGRDIAQTRVQSVNERQGKLLWPFHGQNVFEIPQGRADPAQLMVSCETRVIH